jgi:hypothetical protein
MIIRLLLKTILLLYIIKIIYYCFVVIFFVKININVLNNSKIEKIIVEIFFIFENWLI